ncbi:MULTISPECIES: helix-turn-helix domain-containing protein [Corynebacterium]|uniref:helix-turn-helix domain-containing protein n=1 Tax=Corynebacterium TaxID=1716 RepID=UPI001CEFA32A
MSDQVDDISPTERAVLYFLADKARDHGGRQQAWPSTVLIADRLGTHRRTVLRCLKQLEAKKIIARGDQRLSTRRGGGRAPVVWVLNAPPKEERT